MTLELDAVLSSLTSSAVPVGLRPQLTVDLHALVHNYQTFTAAGSAEVAAVVKANAYGLGAGPVAKSLIMAGCRCFFVVTLDEALELRQVITDFFLKAGLADEPVVIYMLDGWVPGFEDQLIEYDIRPVLFNLESLCWWQQLEASGKTLPGYALKLDSGMTRFGLLESELTEWLGLADQDQSYLPLSAPALVLSHLACADDANSQNNHLQLERFTRMAKQLESRFGRVPLSLSNSAGTALSAEFHSDLVRVGAGLYGLDTRDEPSASLVSVVCLRVPVRQVKRLQEPVAVGYGADGSVEAGARVAVAAGGYADGIHRILGSSGFACAQDVRCEQLGRISMDSAVYDLSELPESVTPNWLDIISNQHPLNFWCQHSDVLGYELLTSIGHRVERHYVGADAVIDGVVGLSAKDCHV